jgi:serine protease Do
VIPVTITPTLGTALGLDRDSGVILSDVLPHSAAEVAGLEPGDVVLSIDGKPMRDARDLGLAVFQRAPGEQVSVEIERGTERQTLKVAVLDQTSGPGLLQDLANYDAALVRELGILAVTLDQKVTPILQNLRRLSGVVVVAVPAEYEGLNPGLVAGDVIYSINGRKVAALDELRDALKEKKAGDPIALVVERNSQLIYVTAELE